MKLNSFSHFRAVSIVFIVAGHALFTMGMQIDLFVERFFSNLIMGGTGLFVFISGFLFHHVFYKRYVFATFLRRKIENVLIPYFILGLLPVIFFVVTENAGYGGFFLPVGDGLINEYIVPFFQYYWTGRFLTAYWYIPFIMVTFLFSPIHVFFIRIGLFYQLFLVFLLSIVSIFMHRPVDNLYVFQSVMYFLPVYFIGIMCSVYRLDLYRILSGKEVFILILIFSLAAIQAFFGDVGNYHKLAFEYAGLDFMYIQKILMCLFFMIYLKRFDDFDHYINHTLTSTSFAIFFIHPFVLVVIGKIGVPVVFLDSWFFYIIFVLFVLFLCVLMAKFIKVIIPNYSRFFIGY